MLAELSAVEEVEIEVPATRKRLPRLERAELAQYATSRPYYYAELRNNTKLFKDFQAFRKGLEERTRAIVQGRAGGSPSNFHDMQNDIGPWERRMGRIVEVLIEQHPLYAWISRVRGLGALSAGQLMGIIGTVAGNNGQPGIGAFDTVSRLWRFCGVGLGQYYVVGGEVVAPVVGNKVEVKGDTRRMIKHSPKPPAGAVIEWRIDKPMAGYVPPYSRDAKTISLEFIGSNFIKQNGKYRRLYDERKDYEHAAHPELTDGHCSNRARRHMVKVWLSHLWFLWREAEGYSTRGLWVHEYGEHTTVYDWRDFIE